MHNIIIICYIKKNIVLLHRQIIQTILNPYNYEKV